MKNARRILLAAVLTAACGALSFCQQEQPPASGPEFAAASLGFAAGEGVAPASADALSEFFLSGLVSDGRLTLAPADRLRDAYQGPAPSCRDSLCARGAGAKLSAAYIFSGEVSVIKPSSSPVEGQEPPAALLASLTLHILEAREGGFEKTISTQCPPGELPSRISALAAEAASVVEAARRSPAPAAVTPVVAQAAAPPQAVAEPAPVEPPAAPQAPVLQGFTEAELKQAALNPAQRPRFVSAPPRKYPLGGAYGISANWPGLGLRWSPDDKFMFEGKAQFATNNRIVGARAFALFPELAGTDKLVPYAGADFEWVFSSYLKGGFTGGLFAGAEFMFTRTIGIGLDTGLYYVRVWNEHGNENDIGIIFNSGITWYFGK